jgi:hypothetical protein
MITNKGLCYFKKALANSNAKFEVAIQCRNPSHLRLPLNTGFVASSGVLDKMALEYNEAFNLRKKKSKNSACTDTFKFTS